MRTQADRPVKSDRLFFKTKGSGPTYVRPFPTRVLFNEYDVAQDWDSFQADSRMVLERGRVHILAENGQGVYRILNKDGRWWEGELIRCYYSDRAHDDSLIPVSPA